MFNLRKYNSLVGVPTRQYSTMHDSYSFNKIPPTTGLLTNLLGNFANVHAIASEKRFVNPNYVNKQNPNIQTCHAVENVTPRQTTRQCANFPANSDEMKLRKSNNIDILETKENTKRQKHFDNKPNPTKKTTKQRSPRKTTKGKSKRMSDIKQEIDEVGIDVLDEPFEDDPIASPTNLFDKTICNEIFKFASSSPVCISFETPDSSPALVIAMNASKINGHRRIPSDCDSEDSFITFTHSYSGESDSSDCDNEDSDDEDEEDEDETDGCFDDNNDDVHDKPMMKKKVRFAENLCEIHPMIMWSHEYEAARKGPWEEYARDRDRFRRKIADVEENLGGIFDAEHRRRIYEERFAE